MDNKKQIEEAAKKRAAQLNHWARCARVTRDQASVLGYDTLEETAELITSLLDLIRSADELNPLSVNVKELEASYVRDISILTDAVGSWKSRAEKAETEQGRIKYGRAAMRSALLDALEWIDAVPQDTVLPTMPGFDRDDVNNLLTGHAGGDKLTSLLKQRCKKCIDTGSYICQEKNNWVVCECGVRP